MFFILFLVDNVVNSALLSLHSSTINNLLPLKLLLLLRKIFTIIVIIGVVIDYYYHYHNVYIVIIYIPFQILFFSKNTF